MGSTRAISLYMNAQAHDDNLDLFISYINEASACTLAGSTRAISLCTVVQHKNNYVARQLVSTAWHSRNTSTSLCPTALLLQFCRQTVVRHQHTYVKLRCALSWGPPMHSPLYNFKACAPEDIYFLHQRSFGVHTRGVHQGNLFV